MRVLILESDASRPGGRQDDTAAIAAACASAGHEAFLSWLCGAEIHPRYRAIGGVQCVLRPPPIESPDLVFIALPSLASAAVRARRKIVRMIAPERIGPGFLAYDAPSCSYWTNAETHAATIRWKFPSVANRLSVVPSLRDYTPLHAYSRTERKYAAAWVGYQKTFDDGTDKGWPVFARIAERYPLRRFAAVSTDELTTPLSPPNVDYFREIPRNKVAAILGQSRLLIQPSKVESAPVTLIEALACGAWPVAYNRGGCAELLGGLGVLVQDEPALLEAVAREIAPRPRDTAAMLEQANKWDRSVHEPRAVSLIEAWAKGETS